MLLTIEGLMAFTMSDLKYIRLECMYYDLLCPLVS